MTPDQGTLLVQQSQRAPLRGVCFAPGGSDCMASCSGHNNGSIAIWELAGGTAQVQGQHGTAFFFFCSCVYPALASRGISQSLPSHPNPAKPSHLIIVSC